MHAQGTFTPTMHPAQPHDVHDGVALARVEVTKVFEGALEGEGRVEMLAARTPDPERAGYVAMERITGSLQGRRGSFVVMHMGVHDGQERELEITVVPGSGTGDLQGIAGRMSVTIEEGAHLYTIDWTL